MISFEADTAKIKLIYGAQSQWGCIGTATAVGSLSQVGKCRNYTPHPGQPPAEAEVIMEDDTSCDRDVKKFKGFIGWQSLWVAATDPISPQSM